IFGQRDRNITPVVRWLVEVDRGAALAVIELIGVENYALSAHVCRRGQHHKQRLILRGLTLHREELPAEFEVVVLHRCRSKPRPLVAGGRTFGPAMSRAWCHRAGEAAGARSRPTNRAQSAMMPAFCCSSAPMPTSIVQQPALSAAILLDYLWAALCMVGAAYF